MEPSKSLLVLVLLIGSCVALKCPHSGAFRHPEDCTKFYTCYGDHTQGFSVHEHKCPLGTVLDDKKLQCVDAEKVPTCDYKKFSSDASDPLCEEQVSHCSDCTHLITCSEFNGEFTNPREDFCGYGTINNNPLYCDPILKKCTDELPTGCNVPNFVCTSSGYFPDPYLCDIYHVCYDQTLYDSHRCDEGVFPKYNSKEFRCDDTSVVECTYNNDVCGDNVGLYPYFPDDRYYALCTRNVTEMLRCPGPNRFNPNTSLCEFICSSTGLFVDMSDCHKYKRCSRNLSGGYYYVTETCPEGLAFNPNSNSCQIQSSVMCPPS